VSTSPRIRILIAEDNVFMRMGTAMLLRTQPDFEVVGEAEDGVQAIADYRQHRPDVLVVDMKMPGLDGVSVTQTICQEFPGARILVLTHYDGDEDIYKALKAGARGYLTKDIPGEELLKAIRALHSGDRFLPPEVADRLAERLTQSSLSGREQQVLERIFAGESNKEIAAGLGLAEKTASMHVSRLLAKLDAKSRTEAVSIGLQRGLLQSK
jgi:two-component system, NarL family, response regulator